MAVMAANDAITQAGISPPTTASHAQLGADAGTVAAQVAAISAAIPTVTAVAQFGSDGSAAIDYVGVDSGPGQRSGIQSLKDAESVSCHIGPDAPGSR
jgi:hypothetical protein